MRFPQVTNEIVHRSPIDVDLLRAEVILQVVACGTRIVESLLFGIDLHRNVRMVSEQMRAGKIEDEAEEDAEIPVVDVEAQEQQRAIREGAFHHLRQTPLA